MKRSIKRIKYKKERIVLSEVLPFELPITNSNRHFYKFLINNKVEKIGDKICWSKDGDCLDEIIKLMFGIKNSSPEKINYRTIPFQYKISHNENDFRELTIIHPKNQLALIEFYENYKQLILYYSKISPYSIRRPDKVAKFTFHKDKTHYHKLSDNQETESLEVINSEYETLKTYFVYKNYSNIHKFYESYKYHRCEKKYDKLFKFDISKCFDSIYTHTLSWSLLNKKIVKEKTKHSKKTFSGIFDSLISDLNYGETNGIVIGPEFSRIFAELILGKIDKNVYSNLKAKQIYNRLDYEIFRYVDDFFVFYNEEKIKDEILSEYRLNLKEYKLYINDFKTKLYDKPLVTEITISKLKISDLINKYLSYKIEDEVLVNPTDDLVESKSNKKVGSLYISSNKLITKFKIIIKETGIKYKDILNYTLSIIDRKLLKILKDYNTIEKKATTEKSLVKALLEILDFTFFLYSVSPRVNTTIKLCKILSKLTEFFKSNHNNTNVDYRHLIYKKIYDNIYMILQKNRSAEHTQVETLYLLIALSELGKEYWLDVEALIEYVNIGKDEKGEFYIKSHLNYFTIVVLLFYIKDKIKFNSLREFIKTYIRNKFISIKGQNRLQNAEMILLLFDIISCPFIDLKFKKDILSLNEVKDVNMQEKIVKYNKYWFTKWSNFKLSKELDAKISQEVY